MKEFEVVIANHPDPTCVVNCSKPGITTESFILIMHCYILKIPVVLFLTPRSLRFWPATVKFYVIIANNTRVFQSYDRNLPNSLLLTVQFFPTILFENFQTRYC